MSGHGHPSPIDFFISVVFLVSTPLPLSNSTLTVCALLSPTYPFHHCLIWSTSLLRRTEQHHRIYTVLTRGFPVVSTLLPTLSIHASAFVPMWLSGLRSLPASSAALSQTPRSCELVQGQPDWRKGRWRERERGREKESEQSRVLPITLF